MTNYAERSNGSPSPQRLSRRAFLYRAGAGVLIAATPATLAACAGPQDGTGTQEAGEVDTAPKRDVDTVRLGHVSPLTGPLATGAINLRNGAQLAWDDITEAGGVTLGGRQIPLEVLFADSRGDPRVGASEAERLATVESACGLMGAYQSGVCETVGQQAERYKVPFLINTGVAPELTGGGKRYTFRHSAMATDFADSQVQYLVDVGEKTGDQVRGVALIHDDTDFGQSTNLAWRAALEGTGIEIVLEETLPAQITDVSSTMAKLKAATPDAILIAGYPEADFLLTNGMAQQQVYTKAVLFSSGGPSNPTFFENTGDNGKYTYAANNWAGDVEFEGSKEIQARYEEKFELPMNSIAMMSYAGVWILKAAVEAADSVEPTHVREALASIRIDSGPVMAMSAQPVEFDGDGQITERPKMVGQVLEAESLPTVWPFDLAPNEPVYPAPR